MNPLDRKRLAVTVAIVSSAMVLTACGTSANAGGATTLTLAAYSVSKSADDSLIWAFESTTAGTGTGFRESYGASGDQSRAVARGLGADVVHFSLGPDIDRLASSGLVAKNWASGPTRGILSTSVVAIVVRKGNPKHITGFADLARHGVGVVTPNPGSSGSARWNILAAYQSVIAAGGTASDAKAYLAKVLGNLKALPGSGRDATTAFQGGTGDALLSYENEAILARASGEDIDYIVPTPNLLIENPGAVTAKAPAAAKRFLAFGQSAQGQSIYAQNGFRPISSVQDVSVGTVKGANDPAHPFPTIDKLFTIDGTFGGWDAANEKFFDDKTGIFTQLLAASGQGS